MVFWWTGRGYLALLTLIGVYGLFGAILTLTFGEVVFDYLPWLWGVASLISAGVTWTVGSRLNGRPPQWPRRAFWKNRLIYPARNRFVSLPVETWAIPMALLSVAQLAYGLWRDGLWIYAILTHSGPVYGPWAI